MSNVQTALGSSGPDKESRLTHDASAMAQATAPTNAELSELAELLAHEDANHDALANEDEAEALKRRSDSQRGARPCGLPWAIGSVVRSLLGIPSRAHRRSKVRN